MNFKALLREAFRTLKRHWIRSVLAIVGISVGVGAFICVVAIGNAGSSSIEGQLQSLGDNFIWVETGSRVRSGIRVGSRGTRSLVLNDAKAILEQVPLIKSISPNVDGRIQVVYGGENWATMYRGVTPEFIQIRKWNLRLGTFFTAADVEADVPVCVLGQTVVENLFGSEDLALVEVAVFEQKADSGKKEYLLVPHLSGAVKAEQRQVVRVIVEGDRIRVAVEPTAPVTVSRQKWDEEGFFAEAQRAADPLRNFASKLRDLRDKYHPEVTVDFGRGKEGSLTLKRKDGNILEFNLGGYVRFRPEHFADALGQDCGQYYRTQLLDLFPAAMKMKWPYAGPDGAAEFQPEKAEKLLVLLEDILTRSTSEQVRSQPVLAS